MIRQSNFCPNLNHRRSRVPVRGCPMCGEIVNQTIPRRCCTDEEHAIKRRDRDNYCSGCGLQLRQKT